MQAGDSTARPRILDLGAIGPEHRDLVGSKAATLAALRTEGFPAPDGFVVTVAARADSASAPTGGLADEIVAAAARLGTVPLAVRSSALAEDRADSSYAGQYETVLNVEGTQQLLDAVARVWTSASADRVRAYGTAMQDADRSSNSDQPQGSPPIAVLVQPMIPADAAGVAFTADPLTGDRSIAVVSAVRGLGERLVSGELTPEEWEVRDGHAELRRHSATGAIDADTALAVAALARQAEEWLGGPQDIEWAAADGAIALLQARPMTALPHQVTWDPGHPGVWLRNFRFGEWLGGPVSPLFESWALTRMERRLDDIYESWIGIRQPPPDHVVVNGWYFYGFNPLPEGRARLIAAVLLHVLPSFVRRPRRASLLFPPLARFGVDLAYREFRESVQPAYLEQVRLAEAEIPTAAPHRLIALIDGLVDEAGTYFVSLTAVAGYAAKAELPLASFYRKVLAPRIGGSFLDLLSGLRPEVTGGTAHDVYTLDWENPPAEVLSVKPPAEDGLGDREDRHGRAEAARLASERRAREALVGEPRLLRRFDRLLAEAQRYGVLREEQARELTLAWPALRQAILRLGDLLTDAAVLAQPQQVFDLRRDEVIDAVNGVQDQRSGSLARAAAGSLASLADTRRAARQRQRRLQPPLLLGALPFLMQRMMDQTSTLLRGPMADPSALVGIPASTGRAVGPARIVRSSDDFDKVRPGDVLVAPVTTPAWSALFGQVCAVATDNGGIGAHASIVAREYGIPAVVGLGDATSRLRDGELVEVRGSDGCVLRI